jgi:hypothetical protein
MHARQGASGVAGHTRQCTAQLANGATCSTDDMCTSANCESSTCKPGLIDNLGWQIMCS